MSQYVIKRHVVEAVRWNPPLDAGPAYPDGKPKDARECHHHPRVRPTSYAEVSAIIKSAGCSAKQPWWSWIVLGVIETDRGPIVVNPGDYVVTDERGNISVMDADDFLAMVEMKKFHESGAEIG